MEHMQVNDLATDASIASVARKVALKRSPFRFLTVAANSRLRREDYENNTVDLLDHTEHFSG